MSKYTGGRIVPRHDGTWDSTKEYEQLTIVLNSSDGISYISRKKVPAGTTLSDTEYWAVCSQFSQQLKNVADELSKMEVTVETLVAQIAANVAASTDSDADYAAEVVDGRIGVTGENYASLGVAIRNQINGIYDELNEIEEMLFDSVDSNNLLAFADYPETTLNGISMTIKDNMFTLSGTSTAAIEFVLNQEYQTSPYLEAGTYTFSTKVVEASSQPNFNFAYRGDAAVELSLISNSSYKTRTITLAEDQVRSKIVFYKAGITIDASFYLYCEEGSTIGDYMPYGYTEYTVKLLSDIDEIKTEINELQTDIKGIASVIEDLQDSGLGQWESEIEATIDSMSAVQKGRCLVFAVLTDTHTYPEYDEANSSVAQYESMISHISEINKRNKLDAVIHLGDFVNTQWLWKNHTLSDDNYQSLVSEYVNMLNSTNVSNIFICMGNHDGGFIPNDSSTGTEYSGYSATYRSTQRINDTNLIVSRCDDIQANTPAPFFAVDYTNARIRCLFLATDMNSLSSDYKGIGYAQALWFKTMLDTIEDGWNILLFGHIPLTRFYNALGGNTSDVIGMINAFNNRSTYDYNGSSLDCDYTGITSSSILAYICGHYHGDSVIYPDDEQAILSCPEVSVAAGGYLSDGVITSGNFYDSGDAPKRTLGTVTEDCFDIMVYRVDEKKIYLTRFGAGEDRVIDCN